MIKKLSLLFMVCVILVGCTGEQGGPQRHLRNTVEILPDNDNMFDLVKSNGIYISGKVLMGKTPYLDIVHTWDDDNAEHTEYVGQSLNWESDVYATNVGSVFKWDNTHQGGVIPLKPGKASIIVTYKGITSVPFEIIVESAR